jgi:ribonucleoside-diphosphate reductase subunit M1
MKGLRNSLLIAPMPTNTTSVALGNFDSFEPPAGVIMTKTLGQGKFTYMNEYAIRHLIELGLWTDDVRKKAIAANSIASIDCIPAEVRAIYKTAWEVPQKYLMKMLAERSKFIDQSSSFNLHLTNSSSTVLLSVLMEGYRLGLKTTSYYVRTKPVVKSINTHVGESVVGSGSQSVSGSGSQSVVTETECTMCQA